ncbi:MAG: replicative DNA helicase [Pseudomonadota bacterium]
MMNSLDVALSASNDDANDPDFRTLPQNIDAEQGLIGMLLIDNRHLEKVSDFLRPDHFFQPVHGRIFEAINTMVDRGQSASPVTLKGYFEKDDGLKDVGGARYLAELASEVPLLNDAKDYAQTIYDLYLRRELITLGEDVVNDAYDQQIDRDASNAIEAAESKLFALAESGQVGKGFITLKDSVLTAIDIAEKAYKTDSHVTGIATGLTDLDSKLGGLHDSDLLILAARPSMGKSSLAINAGYNAAKKYAETGGKEGARVGFFSLEMSSDQIATRILADEASISGDAIRKGNINESDFRRFVEASQKLSQVPLYIDDTPALSIGAVRARARRLKRQHGLDMLMIDYLQLLQGTGSRQSSENRVLEISEITRGLKAIAKELGIPVVALSQLSRAVEQREDKRPMLSDLRESGSIEQDSDVVMFIYREEYYLSRREPDMNDATKHGEWQEKMNDMHNIAEVIVAKQRHGPIGTVKLFFDSNYTRFSDLDTRHYSSSIGHTKSLDAPQKTLPSQ